MGSYAVFLRGINVGGINIKMADLRDALKASGFADARTLLASGNVVLTSSLDATGVKREAEECLRAAFGYEAWVVVVDGACAFLPHAAVKAPRVISAPPATTAIKRRVNKVEFII